jgi:hypothetical protein
MKDFLNFDFSTKPEGAGVRYTMRHKKRDNLVVEFTSAISVRAEHLPDLIRGIMKTWTHKYMRATRKALSPKQKKFYDAVVWFHKQEGRPPSHEEQCDLMAWKSKGTSFYYTKRLIALGWFWLDEDGRVIPVDIAAPETTE